MWFFERSLQNPIFLAPAMLFRPVSWNSRAIATVALFNIIGRHLYCLVWHFDVLVSCCEMNYLHNYFRMYISRIQHLKLAVRRGCFLFVFFLVSDWYYTCKNNEHNSDYSALRKNLCMYLIHYCVCGNL